MSNLPTFTEDNSNFDEDAYNVLLRHKNGFDITLETQGYPVTDQDGTDTCWIYTGLNCFRIKALEMLDIQSLEISQNYILYYHWVERVTDFFDMIKYDLNFALEDITEPIKSIEKIYPDGGNMYYFICLIKKFGIVPKGGFENISHSEEEYTNFLINLKGSLVGCSMTIKLFRESNYDSNKINDFIEIFKILTFQKLKTFYGGPIIKPHESFIYKYTKRDGRLESIIFNPHAFAVVLCPFLAESYTIIRKNGKRDKRKIWLKEKIKDRPNDIHIIYAEASLYDIVQLVVCCISNNCAVYAAFELNVNLNFSKDILKKQASFFFFRKNNKYVEHSMLITGVKTNPRTGYAQSFRLENSYGQNYGTKGHHTMTAKYFKKCIVEISIPLYIAIEYLNNNNTS